MSNKLQPVRGTHDILPRECRARRHIVDTCRHIAETYGFGEIQTPVFEYSEVFHRTLGDTSDVVTKETYTFTDRGGDSLTLRPEFTAGVVRAFLSEGLQNALPVKFFYAGPAFRYERPQKGRLRQFHQIGAELLGVPDPQADVEMIALACHFLKALGLADHVTLEINTLGDAESRLRYRDAIVNYFTAHKDKLSEDSCLRLERNPLRILDSKDPQDRALIANAPEMIEFLTESAKEFYKRVRQGVDMIAMSAHRKMPYILNPALVRGLDYYNHTVFEFTTDRLGAQGTVLAGGRYDGLVETMGGPATPGIGFAAGVERLLALMEVGGYVFPPAPAPVAVVPVGEVAESAARQLAQELRWAGIPTDIAYRGNVVKRMKRADKIGAAVAVMIGEEEMRGNTVSCKDLRTGEQKAVALSLLIPELKALLS